MLDAPRAGFAVIANGFQRRDAEVAENAEESISLLCEWPGHSSTKKLMYDVSAFSASLR
jgi:hypothetical protein